MSLLTFLPTSGSSVDWTAFSNAYPDMVRVLSNTPQDSRHHAEGDVWTHTKMVVNQLVSDKAWNSLAVHDKRITFLAALLHDIAKPLCTKIMEDGRITSAGHSKKGELDARVLLWRENLDFLERETVARIIGSHQKPFFILNADNPQLELRKLSRDIPLNLLFLTAMADARGRYTNPEQERQKTIDTLEIVSMMAMEEGIYDTPYQPADPDTWLKYLNRQGKDIDPNYSIYSNTEVSRVYLMCGLPGMGKDTWINKNHPELPVLSYDVLREERGILHGQDIGDIPSVIKEKAKDYLRNKTSFIWNATHLSGSMRKKSLDLLHAYGAYVEIVYIEASDEKTWRTQNKNRKASVPDKALDKLLFKWEIPYSYEAHSISYIVGGVSRSFDTRTPESNVYTPNNF